MSPDCPSSSGEEDGDTAWKAAINSVAAVGLISSSTDRRSRPCDSAADDAITELDEEQQKSQKTEPRAPKLYHLRAQKLIDEILERSLVMVTDPGEISSESLQINDHGVRLFTKSSRGIVFDSSDRHPPQRTERPRIIPGEETDEKSKTFKRRVRSASVDGKAIIASARCSSQQAWTRSEAREAARRATALREEERVAKLKKLRGEKWLPSLAAELQLQAKAEKWKTTALDNRSKV